MAVMELVLGALITIVEPGTTTGLCGRVVQVGEGVGGVPTVWAVQTNSSRALKAPVADVKSGCEASTPQTALTAKTGMPASGAPAVALPVKY